MDFAFIFHQKFPYQSFIFISVFYCPEMSQVMTQGTAAAPIVKQTGPSQAVATMPTIAKQPGKCQFFFNYIHLFSSDDY